MYSGHAVFNGVDAVVQFRQHAAPDKPVADECSRLVDGQLRDERALIRRILVYTLNVR